MSQAPYSNNDQVAPNDTQAMYMGDQPGFSPEPQVAPDAEQKLKLSQMLLLASLAVYIVHSIASYFLIAKPMMESLAADPEIAELGLDSAGLGGFGLAGTIIPVLIVAALYLLVYILMAKRKKAGRILGFVFAGLGILSSATSLFMLYSDFMTLAFELVFIGLVIAWIVVAANKSISTILR